MTADTNEALPTKITCVSCGADLTVLRMVACCRNPQPSIHFFDLMDMLTAQAAKLAEAEEAP